MWYALFAYVPNVNSGLTPEHVGTYCTMEEAETDAAILTEQAPARFAAGFRAVPLLEHADSSFRLATLPEPEEELIA